MLQSSRFRPLCRGGDPRDPSFPGYRPAAAQANPPQSRTPVLVELFTAEGCSSCPPADDLLAQLESKQPVAGVDIIVLGEHVDYWDKLGWRDRFSSPQYTERQREYGFRFKIDDVYTPQMIVDGTEQFVGNDATPRSSRHRSGRPRAQVALGACKTGGARAKNHNRRLNLYIKPIFKSGSLCRARRSCGHDECWRRRKPGPPTASRCRRQVIAEDWQAERP